MSVYTAKTEHINTQLATILQRRFIGEKGELGVGTRIYTNTTHDDDTTYLHVDFSKSIESSERLVNLINYYRKSNDVFPNVTFYDGGPHVVLTYAKGDNLEQIANGTVKHRAVKDMYMRVIEWISEFQFNEIYTQYCNTYDSNMQMCTEDISILLHNIGCKQLEPETLQFISDIYCRTQSQNKIRLNHNNIEPSNIYPTSTNEKGMHVVECQDCGPNIEHYDVASLVYNLKHYIPDNERNFYINYYYDQFSDKTAINTGIFKSTINHAAFIYICRSMSKRVSTLSLLLHKTLRKKMLPNVFKLTSELVHGVRYLQSLIISSNIGKQIAVETTKFIEIIKQHMSVVSVVLCAGRGTRMKSDLPKCCAPLLKKPMVKYVMDTVDAVPCDANIFVVGYEKELAIDTIKCIAQERHVQPIFAHQNLQLGTGHAMMQSIPYLEDGKIVLTIMGDMPILTHNAVMDVLCQHILSGAVTTVVSCNMKMQNKNGKIIRNEHGEFQKIVECKDINQLYPNSEQAARVSNIQEVNTGMYVFDSTELKQFLPKLNNNNAQHEYYLTDIIGIQIENNLKVECITVDMCEPTGANTSDELDVIAHKFAESCV